MLIRPFNDARHRAAANTATPAEVLAHLVFYKKTFDATWNAKPAPTFKPGADTSAEGVALTKAIAAAVPQTAFLAWAAANPT
ncbi:MAG: hypothetical protein FWD73_02335 [Polyangiaceae bacterium]|nr:hypothetical protein [Polyangiaceae bacterium]